MVTRQFAVARVEEVLAEERRRQSHLPELGVSLVEEHEFGWIVHWQSAAYLGTGDFRQSLVGGGPYLVDGEDGSVHRIPAHAFRPGRWEEQYRQRIRGVVPPDPLAAAVRLTALGPGRTSAIRRLRKQYPS
ncbi:YrhB family protein [Actinoplanes sp. TRM 88003]|uniref:YrhB family protein n=1 Tax=Paractinoplanes aksuensis TaxID=2939490 RepID=A0ABT1DK30_9ACTN|nr:YrhB domain-containing protein [Actinoplanes aksuensis]MCO8271203.1 YrhB family protein [Actinoplanes aksuensis]